MTDRHRFAEAKLRATLLADADAEKIQTLLWPVLIDVVGVHIERKKLAVLVRAREEKAVAGFKQRYERGSIVIPSNKAFKQWPAIFDGDSTITSAVLDRLLHHAETILIEGSSYPMKDRIET